MLEQSSKRVPLRILLTFRATKTNDMIPKVPEGIIKKKNCKHLWNALIYCDPLTRHQKQGIAVVIKIEKQFVINDKVKEEARIRN